VPSSIFEALESALSRLKRRTFIICISNFREEDEESLSLLLPSIGRKHLLLMVSLRETELDNIIKKDNDESLCGIAASYYLSKRKMLYKKWEHSGLLTLDTNASMLSSKLINAYISVKREGLL
jgi:uncharacterized protein (DUF58 family)